MGVFAPGTDKRMIVVTGHYGSGKTEFSVSLALLLAQSGTLPFPRIALADLDIVNPYFRSREREALLLKSGIQVYASCYEGEITVENPALSPSIRAPLEDDGCFAIVDAGGNDTGALVLRQYEQFLKGPDCLTVLVVNANRPETSTFDGASEHLLAIEAFSGLKIAGLINNTHLLMETSPAVIRKGHELCTELSAAHGVPLLCDCYPAPLIHEEDLPECCTVSMPLGMYMRESWLDK